MNVNPISNLVLVQLSDKALNANITNSLVNQLSIFINANCSGVELITQQQNCSNLTFGESCNFKSDFSLISPVNNEFMDSTCTILSNFHKIGYNSCLSDDSKSISQIYSINLCSLVNLQYLKKFEEKEEILPMKMNKTEEIRRVSVNNSTVDFASKRISFEFQISNSKNIAHFHPKLNCSMKGIQYPNVSSFIHDQGNHSLTLSFDISSEEYTCTLSFWVEPSTCWQHESGYFVDFKIPKSINPTFALDFTWLFITTPTLLLALVFLSIACIMGILIVICARCHCSSKISATKEVKEVSTLVTSTCEWCENFSSRYIIQLKHGNDLKTMKICGNQNCFYKYMKVGIDDIITIIRVEDQVEIPIEEFYVKKMKLHQDILQVQSKPFHVPDLPVEHVQTPPLQESKLKTEFSVDTTFSIDAYQMDKK
jgi:hypothetical protein